MTSTVTVTRKGSATEMIRDLTVSTSLEFPEAQRLVLEAVTDDSATIEIGA